MYTLWMLLTLYVKLCAQQYFIRYRVPLKNLCGRLGAERRKNNIRREWKRENRWEIIWFFNGDNLKHALVSVANHMAVSVYAWLAVASAVYTFSSIHSIISKQQQNQQHIERISERVCISSKIRNNERK